MSAGYDVQQVTTADNVGLSFRVAGLATRITAAALDALVAAILVVLLLLLGEAIAAGAAGSGAGAAENLSLLALLLSALSVVLVIAYFTLSQAVSGGRTPGKAALGIRAIRLDGGTIGIGEAFLRSLAYVVDLFGIGPILMFFHPQSRRLGDLLAGTVVVRERTPVTLAAATAPAPVLLRSYDPGPPIDGLGGLGDREFRAIRTFLSRPGLHPAQRAELAGRLAAPLLERLALPPGAQERMWPPELLLERLYLQLSVRFGR
ncbi:MAG TPA: RDD family protein [Candidatus Binatia bacterium]|nr:RDD family protein [Candidatus Binatia bacterium]